MDILEREPKDQAVHGQIPGSCGVLLATTEQKASSPSPVRSERHVRELRGIVVLIFGLIRLRSPTFIGVRINAAMQVAGVNGIRRTIIQTPENRKVGSSTQSLVTTAEGPGWRDTCEGPRHARQLIELLIKPAVNQAGAGNPDDKSDAGHAQKRSDS
jgi:hypothetical protein